MPSTPPSHRLPLLLTALVVTPCLVVLALWFGHDPVAADAARPLVHREGDYVGSAACASCHPDHHASWARTFHRTMTQRVDPTTVLGDFDGRTVAQFGNAARPFRDGDRFFMEVPDGAGRRTAAVVLAVGSHRYQQYFERIERAGGVCYRRLPILWHIGARRWMHLNGVFLGPDDDDWQTHASIWNENCIFCHNTGPRPGIVSLATRAVAEQRSYDSHVGELGIACEACHGPGGAHALRNRDPRARYLGTAGHGDIVDPARLDHERATAICGQCHGQRLPKPIDRIEAWLQTGPTYRPGNLLTDHVTPIEQATPGPRAEADAFGQRFWRDGTARLSAYEYQGVTASPCYQRGELGCGSCHTMHGGDPAGMIEPELRTDRACVQCHAAIGRDVAAHTGHRADGPGSRCLDCHMPRIVYGILTIHRSHRIEVPDPRRDGENGRPHACTLCHADRTLAWSAQQMNRIWGKGGARFAAPAQRPDGASLDLPDAVASLFAGDPVQRAVYVAALGRPGIAVDSDRAAELHTAAIATLFDAYPGVRWLATQSLAELERDAPEPLRRALAGYDHLAERAVREQAGHEVFAAFARGAATRFAGNASPFVRRDFTPDMDAIVPLLRLQVQRAIAIGE